jgi:hypothetical protein
MPDNRRIDATDVRIGLRNSPQSVSQSNGAASR